MDRSRQLRESMSSTGIWCVLGLALLTGCSSAIGEKQVRHVEDLRQEAEEAYNQGDWVTAEQKYSESMATGGLNPDLYVDVLIQRAICLANLSDFDKAHADLDMASQGAASLERIHAARAFVFRSQGKIADADEQMNLAREIDPTVEPYQ